MTLADDMLSGGQAAALYTGLTKREVYHLVDTGRIPAIRQGKRLFFRKSDLDRAFASPSA